jgi:type I restriction enzyme, S subunit
MTPEGWRRDAIGSLGHVHAGRQRSPHFTDGRARPYLRVANVFDGFIRTSDVLEMPFADSEFQRYRLTDGDILLNEGQSLDLVGRAAIYRGQPPECAFQNTLVRFRVGTDLTPNYAFQLFRHLHKSGVFASIATQTTSIAHLGVGRFAGLEVLVPPLAEQRKITAILSSVDDAIEASQAVVDQLQVVKKAMMTDLLTRGLPGRHTKFKMTEIGEVPEVWRTATVGELLLESAYGTSAKCESGPQGDPVLRIPNVVAEEINLRDLKYVSLPPAEVERYRLRPGDILIIRTNGNPRYVGRSAVVGQLDGTWLYASYLIRLRVRPDLVMSDFLNAAMRSTTSRKTMEGAIRTSAGNYNLNTQGITNTIVPLPPITEQNEIVAVNQAFGDRLSVERAVLQALGDMRSSLMSVLLTGEVRVTPDEDAA